MALVLILTAALGLRLAWRVRQGSDDFFVNGYTFYYELARDLVAGPGEDRDVGTSAMRMPLYALFLAATLLVGKSYLLIVIPQALIGAGTALCAYLIGRDLFGRPAGLAAALTTAAYPYYVVHDTALQETSTLTFVTALTTYLLLKALRSQDSRQLAVSGVVLGLTVLTRQTMVPFAIAVWTWTGAFGPGTLGTRLRAVAMIALPAVLPVALWMGRNSMVVGSPVMASELGWQFFNAHNPKTFSHYPTVSIDRSESEALASLSEAEQAELERLADDGVAQSDWFLRKGLEYIGTHPLETIRRAGLKVAAGFSWRFNPAREPLVQLVYLLSYGPISILALAGAFLTRHRWRQLGPIYLQFLCFAAVTAVFWAHTSHRAYLDVYLIVFASHAVHVAASRWWLSTTPIPGSCPQEPVTSQSYLEEGCHPNA